MKELSVNPANLATVIENALKDGKAIDIRVIAVSHITVVADTMVIASGRSARQVKALTDRVCEAVKTAGSSVLGIEGTTSAEWVLVDTGGVLVQIMQPLAREFYQLEKLWSDVKMIEGGNP